MGTVVEFCGLPGAGKSTIARALVGALRLRGVLAESGVRPPAPPMPAQLAPILRQHLDVIDRERVVR